MGKILSSLFIFHSFCTVTDFSAGTLPIGMKLKFCMAVRPYLRQVFYFGGIAPRMAELWASTEAIWRDMLLSEAPVTTTAAATTTTTTINLNTETQDVLSNRSRWHHTTRRCHSTNSHLIVVHFDQTCSTATICTSTQMIVLGIGLKANFVGRGLGNVRPWLCTYGIGSPSLGINHKVKITENSTGYIR